MPKNNYHLQKSRYGICGGFTLVELLISVGIVSLLLAGVLFNYFTFSNNLALSAAIQEFAINVRKAQTYGLSVKETTPGTGQFNVAYGISLDRDAALHTSYDLYVDRNDDGFYNQGGVCGTPASECLERIALRNGVTFIAYYCDVLPIGCHSTSPISASMQIDFHRPNPDPITTFHDGVAIVGVTSEARILFSSKSKSKFVRVSSTGQISF